MQWQLQRTRYKPHDLHTCSMQRRKVWDGCCYSFARRIERQRIRHNFRWAAWCCCVWEQCGINPDPTLGFSTNADPVFVRSSISSTPTAPAYGSTPTYPNTYSPAYATSSPNYASTPSRTYVGNCPTPDSYDAAGRRCGGRSAASRPGGYNGYGSWAPTYKSSYRASSGGSTFVRGYYRRNGTYVRSHTRRR